MTTTLVSHLLRSGMRQADRLRSVDADPEDPNLAIKAYWPSACAYSCLIMTASKISPQLALKRISEIQDPEIQLLLRIRLAKPGAWCTSLSIQRNHLQEVAPDVRRWVQCQCSAQFVG